jgi:S-formylglutathione hydrolase FrmB
MALMTLDFYSKDLKMSTLITLVVPDSVRIGKIPVSQRKCLTLLHGLSDDATACLRLSRVELFAQETGIVVVMPSVGRSMYCDGINGQNYFSHVANEIPEYLNLVMGLSREPSQNYIAGISMGGLGAARVALTYPKRYTGVGLFSGLIDIKLMLPLVSDAMKDEFPFLIEAANNIDETPLNPINLLDPVRHANLKISVCCGMQDDLYPMSVSFYEKCRSLGLQVTGTFQEGKHEWRIWDGYIEKFIAGMGA